MGIHSQGSNWEHMQHQKTNWKRTSCQDEGKHSSEAYEHQKLKRKGNQGSQKWVFMDRTPSGVLEVPEGITKFPEGSRRLGEPQKGVSEAV